MLLVSQNSPEACASDEGRPPPLPSTPPLPPLSPAPAAPPPPPVTPVLPAAPPLPPVSPDDVPPEPELPPVASGWTWSVASEPQPIGPQRSAANSAGRPT